MDLEFITAGDYMDLKKEIQIDFHHIHSVKKTNGEWKEILGDKFAGKNLKRIFELDENVIKRLGEEVLQNGTEENRFRVTMDDGSNYEISIK